MTFYTISSLIAGLSCFAMGMLMFLKGGQRKENRVWGYLCFSAFVWEVGSVGFSTTIIKNTAFFWWQVAHIGTIASPPLFFHFVVTYLHKSKKHMLSAAYLLACVFLAYNFLWPVSFIGDLRFAFNQFYYVDWYQYRNPLYLSLYVIFYGFLLGYSFLLLLKSYLQSVGLERKQLKFFILGSIVGWLGPIGIIPAFFGINLYPYSNILVGVFPVVMGYGIIRHQLMGLDVIIKKTLVFTGLLASVFAMLVLPTFLIQDYILRGASFAGKMTGVAISGVIIILTMRRIENFLIDVTDKYLFQKKYSYKELLKTFTGEVLTVLELNKLIDLTIDTLTSSIKLESAKVILFDDENRKNNRHRRPNKPKTQLLAR